jgi:hypothetical protein
VSSLAADKLKMEAYVNAAMDRLGAYAKSSMPGASVLYDSRSKAEMLFKTNLQLAIDDFNATYARYNDLAARCGERIANIIPFDGRSGGLGAEGFAAAEVLLRQGLSSTITFGMGGAAWGCHGKLNYNDEHDNGGGAPRGTSLLVHSHQFRCVAAWLYEFRRALGPTLFNETLVHVSSEYGRSPVHNGNGSDHAPGATSMTLFSGAIKKPIFIGNTLINSGGNQYIGTWGTGAETRIEGTPIYITKKNVGNAVADVLRVSRVTTTDKAPFTLQNESVVNLSDEGPKNV